MTKINLLNDITQKTQGPQKSKSLFKRLFFRASKPKITPPKPKPVSKPNGEKPELKTKKRPPSVLTPILLFILPLVACFYAEGLLKETMDQAVAQLTNRLEQEATEFNQTYQTPPNVSTWENKYEALQYVTTVLEKYQPLDIQLSIEHLRQITASLPKEAWIKKVTVAYLPEEALHQVDIEGYAFTSEIVLLFLAQLKTQPLFGHVELKFSQPTKENGIEEHRFHVVSKSSHSDINALSVFQRTWLYNQLYPLVWRTP